LKFREGPGTQKAQRRGTARKPFFGSEDLFPDEKGPACGLEKKKNPPGGNFTLSYLIQPGGTRYASNGAEHSLRPYKTLKAMRDQRAQQSIRERPGPASRTGAAWPGVPTAAKGYSCSGPIMIVSWQGILICSWMRPDRGQHLRGRVASPRLHQGERADRPCPVPDRVSQPCEVS
jgi:hypothetical protein